jgi:simple sugar transport system substrate-binding protein
VVGSGSIKQDKGAYELVKAALAGTLEYGSPRVVGVKEGYVDYISDSPVFQKAVSAAVRAKFLAVLASMKSGQLHLAMPVPQN